MLKAFLLVVVGLSGDPEHGKAFQKWGATLAEASSRLGVPPERLVYLVDKPEDPKNVTGAATRDEVTKAFDKFAKEAGPDDVVFITLIGHGTYANGSAKFNLTGPDMSAADFNALIKKLPTKQIVFVDTSSASGPFVEELSGPGRTIITATRNGAEQYATVFGGYFVDALTSEAADADKNKRVSVLEAFNYAKTEVARAYERAGFLATEHALLDDNGDKEGSQAPGVAGKDGKISPDGKVASIVSFGVAGDAGLPSDPKLRELYLERRDLERRIEAHRLLKEGMPAEKYQAELERLATALALKNREIRTAEGQKP
jgi:peptidase C13-like protein